METNKPKRTRVQRIWDAKAKQGVSCQMIVDRAMELGKPVSLQTVKRICNHNSDDECSYPSSFAAVEAALGIEYDNTVERLADDIRRLEDKLAISEALVEARAAQLDQAHDTIEAYKVQVASMRSTVQSYQAALKRKNKLLRIVVVALSLAGFLLVLLFALDMLTPSLGYFRRLL